MVYRTFGNLRQQVQDEMDLNAEDFVDIPEISRYFNSAVILCEAQIVKLGLKEKYLQAEAFISTIAGQTDYDLPSDVVITKIRKLIYRNSNTIYQMLPLRGEGGYTMEDFLSIQPASEFYHYSLYKQGLYPKLRLTPRAILSVTNAIRVVYFKSLNKYTTDSDLCDLPDICYEFLMSYVRYRIYQKETHVNTPDEKANMVALQALMTDTLTNQVADPDWDLVDRDFSLDEESN